MKNLNIISTGKERNGILWEIKQRFCCKSLKTAVSILSVSGGTVDILFNILDLI